jgi:4-amino-4-deoxy-L-arabinose transferase-like glycosyltransferase
MRRLLAVASLWLFTTAQRVLAGAPTSLQLQNPLNATSVEEVLKSAAPKLTLLAAPIVTIVVLYGAFLMITAAGDPEKIKSGKKTLLYAAIGFAVVLLADSIVPVIRDIFS